MWSWKCESARPVRETWTCESSNDPTRGSFAGEAYDAVVEIVCIGDGTGAVSHAGSVAIGMLADGEGGRPGPPSPSWVMQRYFSSRWCRWCSSAISSAADIPSGRSMVCFGPVNQFLADTCQPIQRASMDPPRTIGA